MRMRKSVFVLATVGVCCFASQAPAFVQTDLDRLLKTNECPKCDLSGAVLSGLDLSKAKLEGANLSGADLTKTSLRMADMPGANLSGAQLNGAVLEAADLFQVNLSGAKMDEAFFGGAYLAEATIDDSQKVLFAKLKTESLPQANTPATEEKRVIKTGVEDEQDKTSSVESTIPTAGLAVAAQESPPLIETPQATIPDTGADTIVSEKASGSEYKGACLCSLSASGKASVPDNEGAQAETPPDETAQPTVAPELTAQKNSPPVESQPKVPIIEPESSASAKVVGPINPEALLKQVKKSGVCVECDFSGMKLGSVSMKGFYLDRATFAGAQLAGANFKEASLKSVNFSGANLQGATFKGADLYLADFTGANLDGADFRGAVMDGVILGDATLTGAQLDDAKK